MSNVLFDSTHAEEFRLQRDFKRLTKWLNERGLNCFELKRNEPMTIKKLMEYDVLVIDAPRRRFRIMEKETVLKYVNNGGRLLILVDTESAIFAKPFLSEFGIICDDKEIKDEKHGVKTRDEYKLETSIPLITHFDQAHPIFTNVRSFVLPKNALMRTLAPSKAIAWSSSKSYVVAGSVYSPSLLPKIKEDKKEDFLSSPHIMPDLFKTRLIRKTGYIETELEEKWEWKDVSYQGPFPVAATSVYGRGNVVVLASANIFADSIILKYDNRKLAINVFLWLSESIPSSFIGKRRLLVRFEIDKNLGKGAWKETWKAYDLNLGKKAVAIKILHSKHSKEGLEDLRVEAKIGGPLKHKNIVEVLDINEVDGFLVEEFIEGKDLESLIKEHARKGTWFSRSESINILRQLLEAIHYAHTYEPKGRIHGDIKPANIMIQNGKTVKLTDFGAGKILSEEIEQESTQQKSRLGSLNYWAPEIFKGRHRNQRTDLFSIGILAYLLLTQKHPFLHPSGFIPIPESIQSETFQPIQLIRCDSDIPEKLDRLVMKLLQKDTRRRYRSAKQVLKDLANIGLKNAK